MLRLLDYRTDREREDKMMELLEKSKKSGAAKKKTTKKK
jgi:hypothetical protein